jgi:hypothetical protein
MTSDRLDRTIDRVVRGIVDVEPDDAFRLRVMERVARRGRRDGALRWTLAAAALAGLALAFVVVTRPAGPAGRPSAGTEAAAGRLVPGPAADGTPATTGPVAPPAAPEDARGVNRTAGRAPTPGASGDPVVRPRPADVSIAPLTELAPIALSPLEPEPIASVAIPIEPLSPMPAVEVTPFPPQAERN